MKRVAIILPLSLFIATAAACTVVHQGQVGVQRNLGKYENRANKGGIEFYNPFTATVVKVPVRTVNLLVSSRLPSKEGLNIGAEISILYKVEADKVPELLRSVGKKFESNLILPVFRSAVADISAQFLAKDMHTGSRGAIEASIQKRMAGILMPRGIEVEAVLIKTIELPTNLARAIEAKLEAEQRALRMKFVLNEARQEAERKRIEAEGINQAQSIIAQGLTPAVLQFKSIEAFLKLAKSPNAKVIVSDGDMPRLVMQPDVGSGESTVRTRAVHAAPE